jgi:hypothetical protein
MYDVAMLFIVLSADYTSEVFTAGETTKNALSAGVTVMRTVACIP